ncbi:MAG: amidohydrolase family protein [Planctomycetota bacterium]|nr:amidohydrolase family protein [Planctomycetota bacterium]
MRQTPFGEMFVFDAHTHFFDLSFYENLGRMKGINASAVDIAERLGWDEAPDKSVEAANAWVQEMDAKGVDRMVSMHTIPSNIFQAAEGIHSAAGRLTGYAAMTPNMEGAPNLLDRLVTEFGFRGLALFPSVFRFSMQDEATLGLLDVAHQHGLNIFVHCGAIKIGFRTKLGLPNVFDCTFTPLEMQPICAACPNANFVFPHMGSGYFRELLMLADMVPNIYTDTSGMGGWGKYLDGNPAPHQVLKHAVEVMGAERILFGSDSSFFPRGWRVDTFVAQVDVFQEAGLNDEQVAQILGRNLERMIRVENQSDAPSAPDA